MLDALPAGVGHSGRNAVARTGRSPGHLAGTRNPHSSDDPANLFVAGFIGSPAMNLVEGATVDGRFVSESASIAEVGGGVRVGVVPGVRPEDLAIAEPGEGNFDAEVYANELTGESVLVTVQVAGRRIAAKADRHTRRAIGETVGIRVDPAHTYLFDAASADRIARWRPDRSCGTTVPASRLCPGSDLSHVFSFAVISSTLVQNAFSPTNRKSWQLRE